MLTFWIGDDHSPRFSESDTNGGRLKRDHNTSPPTPSQTAKNGQTEEPSSWTPGLLDTGSSASREQPVTSQRDEVASEKTPKGATCIRADVIRNGNARETRIPFQRRGMTDLAS